MSVGERIGRIMEDRIIFRGDLPMCFAATAFSFDAMAALPRKWVKPEVDLPRIGALTRGFCGGAK
jgi:hypothetical protein